MKVSEASKFHVLGIESSCDDTGVALIDQDGSILSNNVHSQLKRHLSNGGIIPVLAKDYHLDNIDRVANQAFKNSKLKTFAKNVSAIAVTTRPGLQFSLQVGLNYAKKLALKYSKPLIPIHHMQAHALMPLLQNRSIKFPFLALLISGGHCLLSVVKRYDNFHILGTTRDTAPGELLDKFARRYKLKNLGPPFDSISGGAAIELLSKQSGADRFKYFNSDQLIPMAQISSCDFSFSGYRDCLEQTAPIVDDLWACGSRERLVNELGHMCASIQRIMLIQLVKKLHRAIMFYRMHWRYINKDAFAKDNSDQHLGFGLHKIDHEEESNVIDVVVSGGVAANSYFIREIRRLCQELFDPNMRVFVPSKDLCSDNGLMIAWNGLLHYKDNSSSIINNMDQLESVDVMADCLIGLDISRDVEQANFQLSRLLHPELKTNKLKG